MDVNCNFCGKSYKEVKKIIAGRDSTYICETCINTCLTVLNKDEISKNNVKLVETKVTQMVENILNVFVKSNGVVKPHFWLGGKTGTGKTYTLKSLCTRMNIPFVEVNGSELTIAGYVGGSVSDIGNHIMERKAEKNRPLVVFVDEIDKTLDQIDISPEGRHNVKRGVQYELLKAVEGIITTQVNHRNQTHQVDDTLWVLGGAFGGKEVTPKMLEDLGVVSELLGRVSICINTTDISKEELRQAININRVLAKYMELTENDDKESIVDIILQECLFELDKPSNLGFREIEKQVHRFFLGLDDKELAG